MSIQPSLEQTDGSWYCNFTLNFECSGFLVPREREFIDTVEKSFWHKDVQSHMAAELQEGRLDAVAIEETKALLRTWSDDIHSRMELLNPGKIVNPGATIKPAKKQR